MSRSCIPHRARTLARTLARTATLAALAVLCALTPFSTADEFSDVNGAAEAPVIRATVDCLALNYATRVLVTNVEDKAKVAPELVASVKASVDATIARATEAQALIDEAGTLQRTSDPDFAHDSLGAVVAALEKLPAKLDKGLKAKTLRKGLDKADVALLAAKLSMQGVFVESKDPLIALEAGSPHNAYIESYDRGSIRGVLKLLSPRAPSGVTAGPAGKSSTPTRSPSKSVRRRAAAAALVAQASGATAKTVKRKGGPKVVFPGVKLPRDYYLAFSAASKKQTAAGTFDLSLDREIRGPFVTGAALGNLNAKKRDPDGQAAACLRVDVLGTAEYVEMCARATDEGVVVYVEITGGQRLDERLYPDATAADVRIDYDGLNFRMYAKAEGAESFSIVESVFRPLGTDAWIASVGARGLTGKAEVGVDRVYVVAR